MKWRTLSILIGIWVIGALLFSVIPAGAEKGKGPTDPVGPVQSEQDLGSDQSAVVGPQDSGRGGLDDTLQFEARRETPPPQREAEAFRFHQNTTLERFESTDEHGRLFLTFSAGGIELRLRSITGAEAPAADGIAPAEE